MLRTLLTAPPATTSKIPILDWVKLPQHVTAPIPELNQRNNIKMPNLTSNGKPNILARGSIILVLMVH